MAKAPGAPGPTPDPPHGVPPVEDDVASTSSNASRDNDGWFASAWKKTQKDAEETIKFIEEEHKKNVQKFEDGLKEIKTTAEELADGFQSQLEGRKSLKLLREEKEQAETVTAVAQVKLVAASKETQLAEEALRDAGGAKASGEVVKRATAARSSLLLARSEFSAARAETQKREDAVCAAEVALAESAEKRNLMNLLFKRKLTPEEEEEERLLLEESRRLKAVISIQRNFRAAREKRRAAARAAERRRKIQASIKRGVKTVISFFLLYLVLVAFGKACGKAWSTRQVAYAKVTESIDGAVSAARSLAPLDHGYLRGGLASRLEVGEHMVLRDRNRFLSDRVDVLERELKSATTALTETHSQSPCGGCARDAAARLDAEERASSAELRASALSLEVITLRATATTLGAGDKEVRRLAKSGTGASQAWLVDPSVGYSAQVAAAAAAAAAVTTEARVADAVAAAREAEEEAEATKIENEVLRGLIDEGLVPGATVAGKKTGACWAAISEAKAETRIAAAMTASAHAQKTAARLLNGKLQAYAEAKREAERESEAYRVELDALKAAAPELRDIANEAEAEEARRLNDPIIDSTGDSYADSAAFATYKRSVADQARRTVVGAAKLVAAAKLASERVSQAATALRDAESRAEVRRVELETLKALVAGNGTDGVVERAERYVSELPGAVACARDAVERRASDRLRAEEEARAQAETRAEVYRVELAAAREMEATRAKDSAGRGGASLPPIFSRSGEIAALTAEVKRLEKALDTATKAAKKLKPSDVPVTPESATAAARVAAVAAADSAAEADAAREKWRNTTPFVRRVAVWIVASVLGEDSSTRDALKQRVSSLEKRLSATRIAAAAGPGSVCEGALADAADATRRAEQRADAVIIDLDAARNVSLALAASRGEEDAAAGAAEALMAAADKHRKLLATERGAARATLESCRDHAAASSQRAFVAAKAAADTSDLFERHKLRLAAEALEARQEDAMRASLAPALSSMNGTESSVNTETYAFDAAATAASMEAALVAVEEAELRAEALSIKFREAESRFALAPGMLDHFEPSEYTSRDAYLFALFSAVSSAVAILILSRSAIPWLVAAKAYIGVLTAQIASIKHGLKKAEYDAEVLRERFEIAETEKNEARSDAAQQLYLDFDDGNNLGTVVDEMRQNLRKTSELNEAVRNDNDWLRGKLREARDAHAAFMAAPTGGWSNLRKVEEESSAELSKLRIEVERLRSARLDATAVAAAAVKEHLRNNPGESVSFSTVAGDLQLGSPSFRAGMSAAREAAEREAAALRDESEALREANERLLSESARLRLENHELMEDLGGDGAPGITARDAARAIRAEMLEMTAVADAHAETIAAERAARAELAGRIAALAAEATRERRAQAKVYFLGACVAVGAAAASGATYGLFGVEPLSGGSSKYTAFSVVGFAFVAAACLGSWAIVFSVPNSLIKRLTAPVTHIALVDEDLVEPNEAWAEEAAAKAAVVAATVETEMISALETVNASTDTAAVEGAAETTTATTPATIASAALASTSAATVPDTSTSASIPPTTDPTADAPESDASDMALDDVEASTVGRAIRTGIRKVWRPETDVEEDQAIVKRDSEITKLREELSKIQATADRLRSSRNRLKKRVTSARDENDALNSARDEVNSQAETMSLARTSVTGMSVPGDITDAEFASKENRESALRKQLSSLRKVNERMDRELSAMKKSTECTAAEAEAMSASALLEEQLSESEHGGGRDVGSPRASPEHPYSNRISRAEQELPVALERAARAESRAAALESSRSALAAVAAEEKRRLAAAAEAATKEVEWLGRARERLLREVATLRTSNTAIERDLKLSHERIGLLEEDVRENYGVASGLEKQLHEEKRRADVLLDGKTQLESDRKLHEERTAAAIAAAEAATSSAAVHNERDTDIDALDKSKAETEKEKHARLLLEKEVENLEGAKRRLEQETRALRALAESSDEQSAAARTEAARARAEVTAARKENKSLSKELAQAREELLVAREEATVSPARAEIAEKLRVEVDRLADKVKGAYVRETELRKQLAHVARKALEKASKGDAEADARAETEVEAAEVSTSKASHLASFLAAATSLSKGEDALVRDGPVGVGGSSDVQSTQQTDTKPSKPSYTPSLSTFASAPPEKRYKAKQRAIDVLCAASKPDSDAKDTSAIDSEEAVNNRKLFARRSLAAIARVMTGVSAFSALKRGALQSALALMAASPKDRAAQISGCRVISSCVADASLATHAKRSPSFAGGGALRGAAAALRKHGIRGEIGITDLPDASASRAAARAMWTAVHLGGRAAKEEMIINNGEQTVTPLLTAMKLHSDDTSVTEGCVGCLLATCLSHEAGKDFMERSGAKIAVVEAMRAAADKGRAMRFGGAFAELKNWLGEVDGL